jgi:hypothetical protein
MTSYQYPVSLRYNPIHSDIFLKSFQPKACKKFSPPHKPHAPTTYHNFFVDDPNIWWEAQSWSSLLHNFLQPPVTSSLLRPNILHSSLLSNTLCVHSSLNVRCFYNLKIFKQHTEQQSLWNIWQQEMESISKFIKFWFTTEAGINLIQLLYSCITNIHS